MEDRHVERWKDLFVENGRPLPAHQVSRKTRLLSWLARRFGPGSILPLVLAEEGREVQAYLQLARTAGAKRTHDAAVGIANDSATHARELAELLGREGEPWHTGGAGGYLRSIVYGFNDGLTANFGLVAGVVGAAVEPHLIILTGVAGAMADALSMGSSGYLAAKSEAEVQAHQIRARAARDAADARPRGGRAGADVRGEGPDPRARARDGAHRHAGPRAGPRDAGARGAEHPAR